MTAKKYVPDLRVSIDSNPVFAHLTNSQKQEIVLLQQALFAAAASGRLDQVSVSDMMRNTSRPVAEALAANKALLADLENSGGRYMPFSERIDTDSLRHVLPKEVVAVADKFATEELAAGLVEARRRKYREDDIPEAPPDRRAYVEHASLGHALETGTSPIHDDGLRDLDAGPSGSVRNDVIRAMAGLNPGDPIP